MSAQFPTLLERAVGRLAPGLPLVLEGPHGSGRSVISLEECAAALGRGEPVILLTAEPPPLVLRQAESLGIELVEPLRDGSLIVLELDGAAPRLVRSLGAPAFLEALAAVDPGNATLVIDPLTAITGELIDEVPLRALIRGLFAAPGRRLLVTVEEEALADSPALKRVLLEACGGYMGLSRDDAGRRALTVEKARSGEYAEAPVPFEIGPTGTCPTRGGATIHPPHDPAAVPDSRQPVRSAPERRPAVLLVEHDPAVRLASSRWLEERFSVSAPEAADRVLPAFIARRPDVVVLDLEMPGLAGYSILRAIGCAADWIPVLAVQGNLRRPGDRIRPLVLGAADLIPKPVDRFELLHKVDTLLQLAEPPPRSAEAQSLETLMAGDFSSRVLSAAELLERLTRAHQIGTSTGLSSILLVIEASDEASLDEVLAVADDTLRVEDGLHVFSETRGLVLLVAADLSGARVALQRLDRGMKARNVDAEGLVGCCNPLGQALDSESWPDLFKDLVPWSELLAG